MTSQACTRQWDKKVKFGNSFITRLFTIPVEQKKCQGISCYCVSEKRELKKICKDIMKKTGVHIEVSSLNNQNLMIVVMGKDDAVLRAQQKFVNKLKPQEKKAKNSSNLNEAPNTKISVPRPLNHSDVIKISGTKEDIEKAACEIQVIIDKKTGVSVEVPSLHSPSETTFLRRYQEKLGPGPSHLFEEASKVIVAEVSAPSWLHKYIIGRKGASIKHVIQDFPMVLVEFNNRASKIKLEGPQCELERASKTLENMIADLKASFTYEEIHVNPHYYRHVAEKYRDNVYGLQNETLIMAHISSDSEQRSLIRIEGNLADVTRVKQELQEMVHKMNKEITKECMIDKRFHDNIIGSKGEKVKNIRDKFNQVNIELPEQGIKSGKVRIRGCKEDVENCYQYLVQLNQDLLANNYCHKFQVYSQFLKYIIDKGRSEIWKIETETETKIVLPPENSKTNTLIIIGRKENVMASEKRITSLQDELGNVEDVDVIIPAIFHQSIIGIKGQQIRSISANCGYVRIVFPRRGSIKDKFILRGPKEDVDKAKHQLTELLQKKQQFRFTVELKARPEYHKFLIGVKGANVKKVRQKTGARIVFPTNSDEDKETITITGHKEAAMEAKKILEDMMEDLFSVEQES
ncbi:vigilin-like isoform X2 [Limulus polyphemus]|uniref:Vigilin-like isoform X2 n=1 Tax=Limulus polyphemus TaxID=6850 RepID=A0ABM1SMD7_LIMPO|nr:vigilin-like isoform X2 [Limulus polyphemus]